MRTQLHILTDQIDTYNADVSAAVKAMELLLSRRADLLASGKKLGLNHTAMTAMLANVKLKLVTGGSEPVPLGDVLPEFGTDSDGVPPRAGEFVTVEVASGGHGGGASHAKETEASLGTFRAVGFNLHKVAE